MDTSQLGDRVLLTGPWRSVEMIHGRVRLLSALGLEIGFVRVDQASADLVVAALHLVAFGLGGDPVAIHVWLPCPDGGEVELDCGAPPAVRITVPADKEGVGGAVLAWTGEEWDKSVEACTTTLDALAIALSEGATAVPELGRSERDD